VEETEVPKENHQSAAPFLRKSQVIQAGNLQITLFSPS
jgi:hypothetical protein